MALEYLYQGRKKEESMEINPCVENGLSYSETNHVFMPVPVLKLLLTPTEKYMQAQEGSFPVLQQRRMLWM